jgi:Leucine-rich repeat (LRR) protein
MLLRTNLPSAIDCLNRAPNKNVKVIHASCQMDSEESTPAASLALQRSLNAAIVPFRKLTTLSLRHAGLCDVPTACQYLHCLKQLDLSHNRLKNWPSEVKLPSVERLNLDFNRFPEIPVAVGTMATIVALAMSHNSICGVGTELNGLKWLSELDLSHNEVRTSLCVCVCVCVCSLHCLYL